ncbi:hypothetical protein ACC698_38140, partial [Rhizobium johnstonii]
VVDLGRDQAAAAADAFGIEVAILQGSNWVDPIERRRAYNEKGWSRFDDTLDPYRREKIEQERDRYRRTA